MSRCSSVSIMTDYGLDDRGPIPDRGRDFYSGFPDRFWGPPSLLSYPMGTRSLFRGGKARPGCEADHSPPSSAEVENE
jgi:hypothetical protein